MLEHFSNNSIDNSLLDMLHNVSYKKKGREEKLGVYLLSCTYITLTLNVSTTYQRSQSRIREPKTRFTQEFEERF